ncbi:hypothetical protein [Amycolatopsis regifaucium]|uniref:Lipoprotein n=1 Tax=Amycolatopsis regifaucium TaxID=546365 RepID=A0A154MBU1_9PSEU|nr:hypothetical protein [Amycolatopsis regifaucium]KZB81737.1 hypothetical protein AVL48_07095 [Amycolatopsis regifaucium]OKA06197.1 hypothetical protein ATP06_0223915 [Amycolatopsis regifaucium]SFG69784.1 hypothetical protein SAMN04489731_101187 [Amycolatopsis regifaucium]
MRRLPVFVLLLATLTACGQSSGGGGGKDCPAMALMEGVSLDVPPEAAAGRTRVSMEFCWAGKCVTEAAELTPSSRTEDQGCVGDVCSGKAVPTGGKHAAVPVQGLPLTPVKTTVTFDDGKPHFLDVTPVLGYPAGEECGGGVPVAKLVVGPGGEVRQQP